MEEDYAHGRRDGLRLALSILAAEEAKWAALLPHWRSLWRDRGSRYRMIKIWPRTARGRFKRIFGKVPANRRRLSIDRVAIPPSIPRSSSVQHALQRGDQSHMQGRLENERRGRMLSNGGVIERC